MTRTIHRRGCPLFRKCAELDVEPLMAAASAALVMRRLLMTTALLFAAASSSSMMTAAAAAAFSPGGFVARRPVIRNTETTTTLPTMMRPFSAGRRSPFFTTKPPTPYENDYYLFDDGDDDDEIPFNIHELPKKVDRAFEFLGRGGNVEGLRSYCDRQGLRLRIRPNATIVEYEAKTEDGQLRRIECKLDQAEQDEGRPGVQIIQQRERMEFPFRWRTVGKCVAGHGLLLGLGIIASLVFKVPNYGLGQTFSLNPPAFSLNLPSFSLLPAFLLKLRAFYRDNPEFIALSFPIGFFVSMILYAILEGIHEGLEDNAKEELDEHLVFPDWSTSLHVFRESLLFMGNRFRPLQAFLASAAISIVTGVSEEIAFRGVLQTVLARRFGTPVAVMLQSIPFGLAHRRSPLYMLLAGFVGLFLGVIQAVSGNLAITICIHVLWNKLLFLYIHRIVTDMAEDEIVDIARGRPPKPAPASQQPAP